MKGRGGKSFENLYAENSDKCIDFDILGHSKVKKSRV